MRGHPPGYLTPAKWSRRKYGPAKGRPIGSAVDDHPVLGLYSRVVGRRHPAVRSRASYLSVPGGFAFESAFLVASSGSTLVSLISTQRLPTDEWVHMAGVCRPGEAMELYANGEFHRVNATRIPATQYSTNSTPVMIGKFPAYNNCGWTGLIDEARIYARALSACDIL
jgi:hypothetical protein